MILETRGHEPRISENGLEAMVVAEAWRPDVAFIDIGLPGMDGYEVARRLRERPSLQTTELVALSGYSGPDHVQRARAAGFDNQLTKPVDLHAMDRIFAELSAH